MFDVFAHSADGVIILLYVITLILFFLYGPHKVYESLFGALIGIGFYLMVQYSTYITPETTRQLFGGEWLVTHRDTLLWSAHLVTVVLFLFSPMSVGIHAGGIVRNSLWFLLKIVVLSAFFVVLSVVLLALISGTLPLMNQSPLFSRTTLETSFFVSSRLYPWIIGKSYLILFLAFILAAYKILISHWVMKLSVILGAMYAKGNEVFGKRNFEQVITPAGDAAYTHGADGDHAHDHADSH